MPATGDIHNVNALLKAGARTKIPACLFYQRCQKTENKLPAWFRYRQSSPHHNHSQWICTSITASRLETQALLFFCRHDNDPIWLLNIHCGHKIQKKFNLGLTAIDIARHNQLDAITEILEKHSRKPNNY